jgi:hypothetical protein
MGPDKSNWHSVIYHNDDGHEYELDEWRSYDGPARAEQNAKHHALKSMERGIPNVSINLRREYVYTIVSEASGKIVRRVTITHEISSNTEML